MVRSLWSAATGMVAQQTNIDTIANNLANVNTTGYKTEIANFKSLLYQTLQTQTTTANGDPKPVGAQVGLGVRNSSISSIFSQGAFQDSESTTDFAISGKGFFAIAGDDDETYYTRNGNFFLNTNDSGGLTLCTSEGYAVLDTKGKEITFNKKYTASNLTVSEEGEFYYPDADNNPQPLGITIGLYQFNNPTGLEKIGGSYFRETLASGEAINETKKSGDIEKSTIVQGYLERSNVQVVDEMVNMIVAQRAYEMNSKAITTSDEMLQQANNLKR